MIKSSMILHRQRASGSDSFLVTALLVAVIASPAKLNAFQIPSHLHGQRQLSSFQPSPSLSSPALSKLQKNNIRKDILRLAQEEDADTDAESREGEEAPATPFSESDEMEEDPSKTIFSYKSGLSQSRTTSELRPGSKRSRPIDVTMKFGGSSLANAECIDRVTKLIRDRIRPPPMKEDGTPSDEVPVRPRAGECGV